ncbi:hypothetical protein Vi05172_g6221 [Venturia inaequalis]|nr:hypothetical protein Vi05172_g6221 [Venturia inaequalis]
MIQTLANFLNGKKPVKTMKKKISYTKKFTLKSYL